MLKDKIGAKFKMEHRHATQIANLLNAQNQLTIPYTAERILHTAQNYVLIMQADEVIACAEVTKVQWYQFELRHLTVADPQKRNGYGRALLLEAERRALAEGAKVLQSTIRVGNNASESLFADAGYKSTCKFFNEASGNMISVWQRPLAPEADFSDPPPAYD
jgi:N-acetylglutamate synthase-like GNAT family acetyltransferase